MRLRLRLLWIIFSSFWRKHLGVLDESVLTLRVLPNDIDVLKITDDRYLALMDLGRADLAARTGLAKTIARRKWAPLATSACIRFRYPLKAFQSYELRTRIVYWDDHTFYLLQHFERNHRKVATGYVCATFLDASGPVPPQQILAELRSTAACPDKPDIVSQLQQIDALIHFQQKDAA